MMVTLIQANPDKRVSIRASDKMVEHEGELYDGGKEGGDLRNEEDNKPAAVEETTKPESPMDTTAKATTQ